MRKNAQFFFYLLPKLIQKNAICQISKKKFVGGGGGVLTQVNSKSYKDLKMYLLT